MPRNTDKHWQKYGEIDAYFGVLSSKKYKSEKINDASLADFFATGQQLVDNIFEVIYQRSDPDFAPKRGLDFGCGTARLTIPMAGYCDKVVGVDVSPQMLEKAYSHAKEAGVSSIDFVLSDDTLSQVHGQFDFILSYIVFQHIPTKRGEKYFERLVTMLTPQGIGCLHLPYMREMHLLRQIGYEVRIRVPLVHWLLNLQSGHPARYPLMEYNTYNLKSLLYILQQHGCDDVYIQLGRGNDRHSVYRHMLLYFRKNG